MHVMVLLYFSLFFKNLGFASGTRDLPPCWTEQQLQKKFRFRFYIYECSPI